MLKVAAAELMYQFYKENKATLPANISCQREFIIDALCQGQSISEAFSVAAQNAEIVAPQPWIKPKKRKR